MNAIDREVQAETQRLLGVIEGRDDLDLEAMEFLVRGAMHGAGARVVEALINLRLGTAEPSPPRCRNCRLPRQTRSEGWCSKTILTILGPIRIKRRRYRCPVCGRTVCPDDEALGVEGTKFSPATRKLFAHAGGQSAFAKAAEDLELLAGLKTTAKAVERVAEGVGREIAQWMDRKGGKAVLGACEDASGTQIYVSFDGTGAPMRKEELTRSKGKNGAPRTREVKLGCVFTQTGLDPEGRPVRDEDSTTYCGAIETSTDFGHRIRQEALRRGMGSATRTIVITDGAAYNKTIIAEHFPHATAILDLYHAREHLADFCREALRGGVEDPLHEPLRQLLDAGQIEDLLCRLRHLLPRGADRRKKCLVEVAYFETNKEAMRYGSFRQQGLFVGSGVIEAGCRTLIGKRLKESGMFWTLRGANAIIALRCCKLSNRFDDFWEEKAA